MLTKRVHPYGNYFSNNQLGDTAKKLPEFQALQP